MKSSIAYTVVVGVLLIFGYIVTSVFVMNIAKKSCYDTLDDVTSEQVASVKFNIYKEREQMEVAAEIIALNGSLTAERAKSYANAFEKNGMMCSVAFLLSEGEMVYSLL